MSLSGYNNGDSALSIRTLINQAISNLNDVSLYERLSSVGNNIGTGETTLDVATIPPNKFSANGCKLLAEYSGTIAFHATATRQVRVYFDSNLIFNSGAFTVPATTAWSLKVFLMRTTPTKFRYGILFSCPGAVIGATSVSILTSSAEAPGGAINYTTSLDLKLTGTSAGGGSANNDVVMLLGRGDFRQASDGLI